MNFFEKKHLGCSSVFKKASNPPFRTEVLYALYCFLVSVTLIGIASKNSPLYPLQDWVDAHCFYTVGKAMTNGAVLYRDIFEQKGFILYALYAIAYRLFPDSFFGVYLLETLSFFPFLYYATKCIRLYVDKPIVVLGGAPLLAFSVTMSSAFVHGGSVEEMTLFCLAYTLYSLLKMLRSGIYSKSSLFCNGLALGFVFWIKYTILGLQIGVILAMVVYLLINRRFRDLFTSLAYGFLGFITISLPVFIYFISHDALGELWDAYFYHNIFLYQEPVSALKKLYRVAIYFCMCVAKNLVFFFPAFVGLIWVIRRKNFETIMLLSGAVCAVFFLFWGSKNIQYYGLPLSVFAIFGFCAIADLCAHIQKIQVRVSIVVLCVVLAISTPALSILFGQNIPFMKVDREELAQYKFAEIMNQSDSPTLFNYGFLDGGFYYAAGITPSTKHFCQLNVSSPKIQAEIDSYVLDGRTEFIVTRGQKLEDVYESIPYECIASAPFTFEYLQDHYYLYKRISCSH